MPINPEDLQTAGALHGRVAASLLRECDRKAELMPGDVIGPYRIVRELGRGGMAIVYLAERADGEYEQQLALKWMQQAQVDGAGAELFRRERQALAHLRHPNIARILDGGRSDDGRLWFAMDYVDGERLDRHCVRSAVSTAARLALFLDVCAAVAHAHARGLIHRDIKPSNVLVDAGGTAKLLDFGIAALAGNEDDPARFAFTPGFASPEQMRGEAITVAADIYQLGCLLASILCSSEREQETIASTLALPRGDRPASVPAPSTSERTLPLAGEWAHASQGITLPPSLPQDVQAIVRKATAVEPLARYATADALAEDVRAFLAHRPVSARPRHATYVATRYLQRHPLGVAVAACTLALLIGMASLYTVRVTAERDAANRQRAEAERQSAAARTARASTEAINRFLNEDILDAANPLRRAPGEADVSVRQALDLAESRVDARFGANAETAAAVLTTLGGLRYEFGDDEHAQALYERAEKAAAGLPPTHEVRLRLQAERAALLITQQKYDQAKALLDELLNRAQPLLQDDDPRLYEWRLRRLEALSRQGMDPAQVPALRELRQAAEQALGVPNAIAGEAALMAATALNFAGHADQSLADAQYAHQALSRTLGPDHPTTLKAQIAVAHGLRAARRGEEAVAAMREAYALQQGRYGKDTQDSLHLENELAFTLSALGQQDEAEALFIDLVERRGRRAEAFPARYVVALGNLATTRMRQGRYAEALGDYRRAQETMQGVEIPASIRSNIERGRADALRELGRFDEAAQALDACDEAAHTLPADDVRRLLARGSRARLLLARGDVARGRTMLDEAIADLQGSVSASHPGLTALLQARASLDATPH